jgi:hypothetical protein
MRRVPLPGNAWADLRDKEELTVAGRRHIRAISVGLVDVLPKMKDITDDTDMATLGLTEAEMETFFRLQEATVAAFVAAWSLPNPPTLASVGEMPAPIFDALCELTAQDGADIASTTAVPSLSLDVSPGDDVDPKGPSGNSGPSGGPSKESTAPPQTLT